MGLSMTTLEPKTIEQLNHLKSKFLHAYSRITSLTDNQRDAIHRYAKISMIGASTRIENAILTDEEISWIDTILTQEDKPSDFSKYRHIIDNKFSKDRERSVEEVAGCRAMLGLIYDQYSSLTPLTETTIKGLHTELLRYYQKAGHYTGTYKAQPNSVIEKNHLTREVRTVFKTADAGPITETAMAELIKWYSNTLPTAQWPVVLACEFVFRFLAIHPFQDGNGRLGRGMFLLALLQSPDTLISSIAPYLAIDRHIEKHKADYYLVLQQCSNGLFNPDPSEYKIENFVRYMVRILEDSLDDIEIFLKNLSAVNMLSPSATQVLVCFKEYPELRLTTQKICEELTMPRRTVINALNSLLASGVIQKYGQGPGTRYQLVF